MLLPLVIIFGGFLCVVGLIVLISKLTDTDSSVVGYVTVHALLALAILLFATGFLAENMNLE